MQCIKSRVPKLESGIFLLSILYPYSKRSGLSTEAYQKLQILVHINGGLSEGKNTLALG